MTAKTRPKITYRSSYLKKAGVKKEHGKKKRRGVSMVRRRNLEERYANDLGGREDLTAFQLSIISSAALLRAKLEVLEDKDFPRRQSEVNLDHYIAIALATGYSAWQVSRIVNSPSFRARLEQAFHCRLVEIARLRVRGE